MVDLVVASFGGGGGGDGCGGGCDDGGVGVGYGVGAVWCVAGSLGLIMYTQHHKANWCPTINHS